MGRSVIAPFSEHAKQVRLLKLKDRHFARLYDELVEVSAKIDSLKTAAAPSLEELKIRRVYLTEKLQEMLLDQDQDES